MLQKPNFPPIVFFSDGFDWELRGNRYYLPYYWSFKTRVLVVAPHSSFKITLKRVITQKPLFFEKLKENLFVFKPGGFLPLNKTWDVSQNISYKITRFTLKRLLKKLKIRDPILWFFYPEIFQEMKKINHSLLIYHLVDNYPEYSFYYKTIKEKIAARELNRRAGKNSDLVLASSIYLLEKSKLVNKNTFLIENGAEIEFIIKKLKQIKKKPLELKEITPPIIGFIGNMSKFRFDFSLVEFLVKNLKDINFVFIGPTDQKERIEKISFNFKNCFYLGIKSLNQVPRFLKFFDVAIIPYKKNNYTKGVLPIKLFEYLAAGKPVVATNLYSLAPFKKLVYLADNKEDFIRKLKEALKEKDKSLTKEKIKVAKDHSWEKLIRRSEKIIQEFL